MTRCCDITAGQLRSLIQIERVTETDDDEGGFTEVWSADPVDGVYARMKAMGGTERMFAMRETPLNTYKIVIRFRDDGNGAPYYSSKDRIFYKNRYFAIKSVVDVEDRRKWIEMIAAEGGAS
jgi:SPP1 family predicted phage head-tail adaptor